MPKLRRRSLLHRGGIGAAAVLVGYLFEQHQLESVGKLHQVPRGALVLDRQRRADAVRCWDHRSRRGHHHVHRLRQGQLPGHERRDGVQCVRGGIVLRRGGIGATAMSIGLVLERDQPVAPRQLHRVPRGAFVLNGQHYTDTVRRGNVHRPARNGEMCALCAWDVSE